MEFGGVSQNREVHGGQEGAAVLWPHDGGDHPIHDGDIVDVVVGWGDGGVSLGGGPRLSVSRGSPDPGNPGGGSYLIVGP